MALTFVDLRNLTGCKPLLDGPCKDELWHDHGPERELYSCPESLQTCFTLRRNIRMNRYPSADEDRREAVPDYIV